jgi:hypothetical protein
MCPNRDVIPIASFKKSTKKIVSQSDCKDKCDSDANKHIEHGMKHSLTRKPVSCVLFATQYSLVDGSLGTDFVGNHRLLESKQRGIVHETELTKYEKLIPLKLEETAIHETVYKQSKGCIWYPM